MATIRFNEHLVSLNEALGSKEEVISALAQRLTQEGCVKPTYLEAVLTRETNFPTGLPTEPFGVAIPHADPEHCLHAGLAVAVLPEPVTFGLMGSENDEVAVRLVFLLALPAEKQVVFLSDLAQMFQTPGDLKAFLQLDQPSRVVDFITTKVDMRLEKTSA